MATDLFEAVRAAEGKAEAVLNDAQREALKLVKDAETACAEKERAVAREHRALYQSIIEEKRKAMTHELEAEAERDGARVRERMDAARGRMDAAVQYIAERVMSDGDR